MCLTMLYSSEVQLLTTKTHWQQLSHPVLARYQVQLWICSVDTAIPQVSGNKCLKLKYALADVFQQQKAGVFTFGGAFSNHLSAVAASCKLLGLQSVAYVRSDSLDLNNPTLAFCAAQGMQLKTLDRSRYRQRHDAHFIRQLQQQHPQLLSLPEGGTSAEGARGVAELELAMTPEGAADLLVCASASGGTLAGIINRHTTPVLGIAVVKDRTLPEKIKQLLLPQSSTRLWQLSTDYTGAGYARFDDGLLQFCRDMARHQLYVEPIYTGKALAGLFSMITSGQIAAGSRVSFLHTGGLQGLQGLHYRGLITATDLALLSGSTAG